MKKFDTIEGYYNFFRKIPAKKWTVNSFYNPDTGCRCAAGHLMTDDKNNNFGGFDPKTLNHYALIVNCAPSALYSVNDGKVVYVADNMFDASDLGDTPKERILNFLTLQASGILNEID